MAGRELKVTILGDASSAKRAFGDTERAAGGLKDKLKGFGGGFKAALTPAAIGGVAAAGGALAAFGVSSVQAFADSEQASLKLQEAFRKFPKLGDSTVKSFEKQAEALATKTKFDDDATKTGQAALAQFGLTGKQVKKLTPLLQDYAAKTGKDLPSAALDLGKAIQGQGRALKKIGIDFEDTGDKTANFEQLMGGLRKQVGGFAEKEGNTASGKLAILQNRFGELQEKVGEKLLPVLIKIADWMVEDGIPAIEKFAGWIGDMASKIRDAWNDTETFRTIVANVFGGLVTAAQDMRDKVVGAVRWLVDKVLGYYEWLTRAAAKAFGWVPGLGGKLKEAAKAIEKFRDDVNESLGGIKDKDVVIRFKRGDVVDPFGNVAATDKERRAKEAAAGAAAGAGMSVTYNISAADLPSKDALEMANRDLGWRVGLAGGV